MNDLDIYFDKEFDPTVLDVLTFENDEHFSCSYYEFLNLLILWENFPRWYSNYLRLAQAFLADQDSIELIGEKSSIVIDSITEMKDEPLDSSETMNFNHPVRQVVDVDGKRFPVSSFTIGNFSWDEIKRNTQGKDSFFRAARFRIKGDCELSSLCRVIEFSNFSEGGMPIIYMVAVTRTHLYRILEKTEIAICSALVEFQSDIRDFMISSRFMWETCTQKRRLRIHAHSKWPVKLRLMEVDASLRQSVKEAELECKSLKLKLIKRIEEESKHQNSLKRSSTDKKRRKRNTKYDYTDAETKIISFLENHHEYQDGFCQILQPIRCNETAKILNIAPGTLTTFWKKFFSNDSQEGSYKTYCKICSKGHLLGEILKKLTNEPTQRHPSFREQLDSVHNMEEED